MEYMVARGILKVFAALAVATIVLEVLSATLEYLGTTGGPCGS